MRKDQNEDASDRDFSATEISTIQQLYRDAHISLNAIEPANGLRMATIECDTEPDNKVQYLALPDGEHAYAYLKRGADQTIAVFYHTIALQESMACAYEIWLGRDTSNFYSAMAESKSACGRD